MDLYKGSFPLVCGTPTLLRVTKMHLKRNRFCSLLGPSQCGMTMLMRAIASEQLEVFPRCSEFGPIEGLRAAARSSCARRAWILNVSQVSRVAVIDASGEGKSTAIRVLVGGRLPTSGSNWKAADFRLVYVARHAFHRLEKHMQETPKQYIMWFFAGDDERESLEFKFDGFSADEESARS